MGSPTFGFRGKSRESPTGLILLNLNGTNLELRFSLGGIKYLSLTRTTGNFKNGWKLDLYILREFRKIRTF